jgi:hypothetical protein
LQIADVYTDLGEREKAVEWLAAGIKLGSTAADIETRPAFDGLVKDPRISALLHAPGSAERRDVK